LIWSRFDGDARVAKEVAPYSSPSWPDHHPWCVRSLISDNDGQLYTQMENIPILN